MRDELQSWARKGYSVQTASVNFIVAWKSKEAAEETAVLLPELKLKKLEESQKENTPLHSPVI
ncbi:MAG: hypothetical protein IJT51_06805 [Bacteroidales bacterium]|nr:hypothetical protein [Bacteroidales bacterium]